MRLRLVDIKTGWYEVSMGINKEDIDTLINNLSILKGNSSQHFHITSDYSGDGGLGEIEIYVDDTEASNMQITTLAIEPTR
ncbi:MAG: hypothetical protein D3904_04090 [Candidatus Electrothrix sp. EH2]|nr:hypothetical protein [Candidatus Electrothrix sp. EH2]